MSMTMKLAWIIFLGLASGCGSLDAANAANVANSSDLVAARAAVGRLGSAFVDRDSNALLSIMTPELRASFAAEGAELDRLMLEQIDSQRSGWMRTLGDDAKSPRIHSVVHGYGDEEVTIEIAGAPSVKKLYFQWVDGELRFSGVFPKLAPGVLAATAAQNGTGVVRKFAVENFTNISADYAFGGDWNANDDGCAGGYQSSGLKTIGPTRVVFEDRTCGVVGFTCRISFNNQNFYGGYMCAGAHGSGGTHDGTRGCFWQSIGDDMWFISNMHGGTIVDIMCNQATQ